VLACLVGGAALLVVLEEHERSVRLETEPQPSTAVAQTAVARVVGDHARVLVERDLADDLGGADAAIVLDQGSLERSHVALVRHPEELAARLVGALRDGHVHEPRAAVGRAPGLRRERRHLLALGVRDAVPVDRLDGVLRGDGRLHVCGGLGPRGGT